MTRDEYKSYLESPAWQKKRLRVEQRARGVCEGCAEAVVENVHHLTYQHVGAEFLFELVGLCRACHERLHGIDAPEPVPSLPPTTLAQARAVARGGAASPAVEEATARIEAALGRRGMA